MAETIYISSRSVVTGDSHLFSTAIRYYLFLKTLERVRRRYRLVVLAYVVMPEHIHLLVSEPQREIFL